MFEKFFGGGKKAEDVKNEAKEEVTQEATEEEIDKAIDKKEIGLSQETKERLSARRALNPDGTVHVPADEAFGHDQERAA